MNIYIERERDISQNDVNMHGSKKSISDQFRACLSESFLFDTPVQGILLNV